jgi:hypothetical protein
MTASHKTIYLSKAEIIIGGHTTVYGAHRIPNDITSKKLSSLPGLCFPVNSEETFLVHCLKDCE